MRITRLDLPKCAVGEGPVWDVAEQALYYIDILARKVFRWDPATGGHRTWEVPDIVGSMALREGGGAVVALDSKVTIDNSALFRHPELAESASDTDDLDEQEKMAKERGLIYVCTECEAARGRWRPSCARNAAITGSIGSGR